MSSTLGWIEISPAALRRLRQDLEPDAEGVRDEIGLLALHSGYAERFFPGTSVQHRRPRYLFFTCWNYLLLDEVEGAIPLARKEAAEDWVKRQLMRADQKGVIGARLGDARPSQPPDTVYWSALERWGFYRGPPRSAVLGGGIARRRVDVQMVRDDQVEPVGDEAEFFVPKPPHFWFGARPRDPLTFSLPQDEARFLQARLESLDACILSSAAHHAAQVKATGDSPWAEALVQMAAEERGELDALKRARRAASLAEIVRATYAALVEVRRELTTPAGRRKTIPDAAHYRDHLKVLLRGASALRDDVDGLDLAAVKDDVGALDSSFAQLLGHVQERVRRVRRAADVEPALLDGRTLELFTQQEVRRKDMRARLADTVVGAERRADFQVGHVGLGPLDYRWPVVKTLLRDLHDGLRTEET
jgi:hypothetical protein